MMIGGRSPLDQLSLLFSRFSYVCVFLLMTSFISHKTHAAFHEIGANYAYGKKIFGVERENTIVSRNYSGNWAIYLFDLLAIELTYSYEEETTDLPFNEALPLESIGYNNKMITKVWGIGFRQSLAPRKSLIRPMISIGYAKEITEGATQLTYYNPFLAAKAYVNEDVPSVSNDSVFASFTLQLKLTKMLRLNGGVKSIFPAFDFNKAKDNLKYYAGFSWYF